MKIRYTTRNSRLHFERDVASPKEAFTFLATIQEVFEETACGMQGCGSVDLKYDVREYDGNLYFKLTCLKCHATIDFGQRKDGENLFIKRKDADGNTMANRGWYKYQGSANEPPPQRSGPPQRQSVKERREIPAEDIPF